LGWSVVKVVFRCVCVPASFGLYFLRSRLAGSLCPEPSTEFVPPPAMSRPATPTDELDIASLRAQVAQQSKELKEQSRRIAHQAETLEKQRAQLESAGGDVPMDGEPGVAGVEAFFRGLGAKLGVDMAVPAPKISAGSDVMTAESVLEWQGHLADASGAGLAELQRELGERVGPFIAKSDGGADLSAWLARLRAWMRSQATTAEWWTDPAAVLLGDDLWSEVRAWWVHARSDGAVRHDDVLLRVRQAAGSRGISSFDRAEAALLVARGRGAGRGRGGSQGRGSGSGAGGGKRQKLCHSCGKPGHLQANCPNGGRGTGRGSNRGAAPFPGY
jgi:hypothetical protein